MKGYFLKLISINVSDRTFSISDIEEFPTALAIGGKGLAGRLLLEHNPAGVDPLSPDNTIIFASGPLAGSSLFGSSRYGVFSKSPLTGIYGESYSGGSFAEPLVQTGFDAVIMKGASETPVFIEINPDGALFHDARGLWGRDTFETEDDLRGRFKGSRPGIAVIGPAGENQVHFAVIKNDSYRVAGRTGMGAVLGSKKIKAIVCYGDRKREFHDPEGIREYKKNMVKRLKDSPVVHAYKTMGTPMMVDAMNNAGAFPTQYWHKGRFDSKDNINAAAMAERLDPKPHACRDCFLACGKQSVVQGGRHKGLALEGPEYETIYAFGGLCMIEEIEEIACLNRLCDSLGMDTISSGNLAAFAIEAGRNGKTSEKLEYGSPDDVIKVVNSIAERKGIGAILSKGIRSASREFGMEETAVHVKGLEPAGYDPRAVKGMGLAYAISERGACHLRSTFYKAELSGMTEGLSLEESMELFLDFEDRCTLFDSMMLCRFYRDLYPWEEMSKLLFMATGMELDKPALQEAAGKIKDNTRCFNLREGMTAEDDVLPPRFYHQGLDGAKGFSREELRQSVDQYYKARGWDTKGVPDGFTSNIPL